MSKKLVTVILFIIGFLLYFIQKNIFSNIPIAGIAPNIFIIYILFLGLYTNSKVSIAIGIFIGFLLDAVYGKCIGISSTMFGVLAYFASYFDKNFSKDNKITILLMCLGATCIYEFGYYVLNMIVYNFSLETWFFIKILFIEIIYNILILIIIYPVFQKLGYMLDRKYKKSNLLTRYF